MLHRLHAHRQQVIAVFISIGLVILITYVVDATGGTAPHSSVVPNLNRFKYIAMAQNPFSDEELVHHGLFAWRILTPLLVFLLPLGYETGFHLTTTVGLTLTLYFTYLYLCALRFGHWDAIMGLLLFALLPGAFRFNLWDFFLADPLALAFVAIAFYLMETRRHLLLALCMALGVTNKEFMLFLVPVYVLFAIRNYGATRRFVLNTLMVCAPAILIYLTLRAIIPSYNIGDDPVHRAQVTLSARFFSNDIKGVVYQPYIHSIGTWGILLPLFLTNVRAKISWLLLRKEWLIFLLLVYAQIIFAVDDRRHLVYAFPVVIPLAIQTVRFFSATLKSHHFAILIGCLIAVQISFLFQEDLQFQFRMAVALALALAWPLLEGARLLVATRGSHHIPQ